MSLFDDGFSLALAVASSTVICLRGKEFGWLELMWVASIPIQLTRFLSSLAAYRGRPADALWWIKLTTKMFQLVPLFLLLQFMLSLVL